MDDELDSDLEEVIEKKVEKRLEEEREEMRKEVEEEVKEDMEQRIAERVRKQLTSSKGSDQDFRDKISRRSFLKTLGLGAGGLALSSTAAANWINLNNSSNATQSKGFSSVKGKTTTITKDWSGGGGGNVTHNFGNPSVAEKLHIHISQISDVEVREIWAVTGNGDISIWTGAKAGDWTTDISLGSFEAVYGIKFNVQNTSSYMRSGNDYGGYRYHTVLPSHGHSI